MISIAFAGSARTVAPRRSDLPDTAPLSLSPALAQFPGALEPLLAQLHAQLAVAYAQDGRRDHQVAVVVTHDLVHPFSRGVRAAAHPILEVDHVPRANMARGQAVAQFSAKEGY